MPVPNYLIRVVDQQEQFVTSISDPRVTHAAKLIAYYSAMIDAAKSDPLDDQTDQDGMLQYLTTHQTGWIESYQSLVNEIL